MVVLQVTPSFGPRVISSCTKIWLFAVTAEVLTVMVLAEAAMTTEPAAADPHAAGDAELEQFAAVLYAVAFAVPAVEKLPRYT